MRATTTLSRPAPSAVTSSTSRPMAVNTALSSSRDAVVGTWLRSQLSENFMSLPWGKASLPLRFLLRRPSAVRPGPTNVLEQEQPSAARLHGASSVDLLEEAHVVVEERPQVIHAITQHRKALHAQPECKAGVAFRIDADVAQHVRVDHAAAEHFQPAGAAVGLLP